MDGYKFLKPKNDNALIRDPLTKMPLAADGEFKPWVGKEGTFWRRRVDEGSCVIVENTEKIENIKFDDNNNIVKKNKGGK